MRAIGSQREPALQLRCNARGVLLSTHVPIECHIVLIVRPAPTIINAFA